MRGQNVLNCDQIVPNVTVQDLSLTSLEVPLRGSNFS